MSYDFKNLSPLDFERLVRDLLSAEWNIKLHTFRVGRDGGIDIRGFKKEKIIIIQCKHYSNSTFPNLKSSIKEEIKNLEELNPNEYYIATSMELTPANKQDLFSLIKEYAVNPDNNIIDCDYLNQLLSKYQQIERKHFKLWLNSTNILSTIIHSDVHNNSYNSLDEIRNKINLYVPNKSYSEAIEKLKEHKCVIISGIPGIGKTTLAEIIIYNEIARNQDTEYIKVSNHIREAQKLFNLAKRQIFYYDDFLGQTQLSDNKSLEKNEDADIINFIKQVKKTPNKKIILTTREYILNQAKNQYEKLDRELGTSQNIEKCVIDLSSYTEKHKAEIFYNHLYHSLRNNLAEEKYKKIVDNILIDKQYKKIINHKNYSPRIIEWVTNNNNIIDINNHKFR